MNGAVYITGGAGFIGSTLARALVEQGRKVTVLDNLSVGLASSLPPGASLVVGDVTDVQALARAMEGHSAVVHFAARVAIRSSFEFAVEDTHTNVVGTAAVMRAAALCGVKRVVAASSMAVYTDSPTPTPVPETHPTRPISPYGISKLALEQLVHGMAASAGIGSLVLRFFNTYGAGQALSPYVGAVTIFTHALQKGQVPTVFGDGDQCRDFVHVADVVQGCLRALDADVTGETINIGTGIATSVNRVVELVQATLGTAFTPAHALAVPGELRYSIADISKARALLGYAPKHALADSLPEVVRSIAARIA
jgi:UDP-glucose 4-epimerase